MRSVIIDGICNDNMNEYIKIIGQQQLLQLKTDNLVDLQLTLLQSPQATFPKYSNKQHEVHEV